MQKSRLIVSRWAVLLFSVSSVAAAAQLPQSDLEANIRQERDYLAFDAHYKESRAQRGAKARALGKLVFEKEASGQKTSYSHQILFELVWLLTSTADFKRIDQRLDDLHRLRVGRQHQHRQRSRRMQRG